MASKKVIDLQPGDVIYRRGFRVYPETVTRTVRSVPPSGRGYHVSIFVKHKPEPYDDPNRTEVPFGTFRGSEKFQVLNSR